MGDRIITPKYMYYLCLTLNSMVVCDPCNHVCVVVYTNVQIHPKGHKWRPDLFVPIC